VTATTVDASLNDGSAPPPRLLVVMAGDSLRAYPLPESGEIAIGRGPECDVVIDHPRVSRRHAILRLGVACTVEDLDSRNGTIFRGERLPQGTLPAIEPGESFSIGPFTLVLMPRGEAAPQVVAGRSSLRVEDPAATAPSTLLTTIARSAVNVLIRGETGVGKEVLAETLHRLSGRTGDFLRLNCAALSEALLESELFGHERGAFTGAVAAKAGLLEVSAGGTVLLDEIGEMPAALQAKLLRAIEAREVFRVGGVRPIAIDVRFLAATHRELHTEIARGAFRSDLYYRLAGMTLEVPPLRQRPARISALANHFAEMAAARSGTASARLGPQAMAALLAHDWPGNARELRNVIERALLLAEGGEVSPQHLMFDRPIDGSRAAPAGQPVASGSSSGSWSHNSHSGHSSPPRASLSQSAEIDAGSSANRSQPGSPIDAERDRILAALEACAGNQTRAAQLLGISRATLVNKLAIHRIPRPRKPGR
jgi:two-component system, NtrC family, response regulator AtoC